MLDKVNPKAIEVCRMLQERGFQSYLVGGCVRDLIMGSEPKDWDIATNASPKEVKSIFPNTYDTGIAHGTVSVMLGEPFVFTEIQGLFSKIEAFFAGKELFEVTTFRTEGKYLDGRHPSEVTFVGNVEDDLARRDLTINAIAFDPIANVIVDPFGGQDDIKAKVIRAVGKASDRFAEDGLRTMRVARFAARFGFEVDPETKESISSNLDVLAKISKERIRNEIVRTFEAPQAALGLTILHETGAFAAVHPIFNNPRLPDMIDRVRTCQGSTETKIAVLFSLSTVLSIEPALRELKFSNTEIKKVKFLFDASKNFLKFEETPTAVEARRFLAFVKNNSPEDFDKSLKEFFHYVEAHDFTKIKEFICLIGPVPSRKELDISGDDLLALGVAPGPQIKKILDSLYEMVLVDLSKNKKDILVGEAKLILSQS